MDNSKLEQPSAEGLCAVNVGVCLGGRTVLSGVSTLFKAGALHAVIGPNGAGKSTLLRVLAGVLKPGSGRVFLNGAPLSGLSKVDRARQLAWLPQRTSVDFGYSVHEVVSMGRMPHMRLLGQPTASDRRAVEEAMVACTVTDLADRPFGTLSGGEQQRAMIARCFASGAGVMILDEPLAGLDFGSAAAVMELLRAACGFGKCVVSVMHDINAVAAHCAYVVALQRGSVAWQGSVGQTLSSDRLSELFGVAIHREGPGAMGVPWFGITPAVRAPSPGRQ